MQIKLFIVVSLLTFSCQQGNPALPEASPETSPRIISMSGFLTEGLFEIGHGEQLVGRDVTSTYPADLLTNLANLGHVSQLNAEAILALKPSLIFVESAQKKQSEVVQQLAGGRNVIQSFENFRALTPEALLEVAPDVILMFSSGLQSLEGKAGLEQITGISQTSFQFFNKRGEVVHKVYCTPHSNLEAYHQIVQSYTASTQVPIANIDHSPIEEKASTPDESIEIEAFQQAWQSLKDTHDFFGLLRKYKVDRTQGFRLAPAGFTKKIDNRKIVSALEMVAEKAVPIMCFVHSKGCIQIHSGEINKLKFYGDWYNILDPKFNLHLNLKNVAETWIVKKPTDDGIVTSIELFDKDEELIVYFFGARKPGKPELEGWREIVAELDSVSNNIV